MSADLCLDDAEVEQMPEGVEQQLARLAAHLSERSCARRAGDDRAVKERREAKVEDE